MLSMYVQGFLLGSSAGRWPLGVNMCSHPICIPICAPKIPSGSTITDKDRKVSEDE